MDNPELHGDERILIRTTGVHVKSISFEAVLTNKRIILIDRSKNILPKKEIPLTSIQTVESGENAIRETMITLAAVTKDGRMRQMVLTFSGEGGGNRAKERNEWVRVIKENITPSFERVNRTIIPGIDPAEKSGPVSPPGFGIAGSRLPPTPTARYIQSITRPSERKIEETPLVSWQAPAPAPAPASESVLGTYCTRCGTKVPEGSGFCNKCGSRIIVPGKVPQVPVAISIPVTSVPTGKTERPIEHEIPSGEKLIEPSPVNVPGDPLHAVLPGPTAVQPQKRFMSRFFSPKNPSPTPRVPRSMPPVKSRRSRKKLVLALVIVIVIIAVVAVAVVLPKTRSLESILSGFSHSGSSTEATTPATTMVHAATTETTVPTTQVTAVTTTPVIINQAASIVTSATTPVIINQAASIVT
ncbi:MAG: zinc ribbon domain-containing protein [Methanoregula sp.]|jgi:hypothetical protein